MSIAASIFLPIDGKEVASVVASRVAGTRAADLETIYNVELITVGTWNASTGVVKFTKEHLQSILDSQSDPFIKPPRLIIGHTPGEYDDLLATGAIGKDGFFGEQPTIGKFVNLRLNDGEDTIVADLVGVPKWLAEILPTAFPNRSVEVYWNVKTQADKQYAAILPRVAALGINLPAVASLEDLQVLYSEEGPDGVELVHVGERVAARAQSANVAKFSIDVEAVRQAYYDDFAQGDRYWWWLKAMFVNPSIIIALDEDNGDLYSVPWSATGESVEFGEPVQVFMQYVESETGKVAAQRAAREAFLLGADIVYQTAAESRPQERTKAKQQKETTNARARSEAFARFVASA